MKILSNRGVSFIRTCFTEPCKGFSFIEIILVLAIVSIISLIGTVFYTRFLTQNSVANTTDHMISQLRRAQIYSMEGRQNGGNWGVNFTASPKQVQFYLQGNTAFNENYSVNSNVTVSPTFNVLFSHYSGIPTGATFPLTITISDTNVNVSESITINSQGVVSKN